VRSSLDTTTRGGIVFHEPLRACDKHTRPRLSPRSSRLSPLFRPTAARGSWLGSPLSVLGSAPFTSRTAIAARSA
jgi:hypothetical protein